MAVKRNPKERKIPGGIALKPSLWERIDRLAEVQEKSRNQVMEEVLSLHVPVDHASTISGVTSQETVEWA